VRAGIKKEGGGGLYYITRGKTERRRQEKRKEGIYLLLNKGKEEGPVFWDE